MTAQRMSVLVSRAGDGDAPRRSATPGSAGLLAHLCTSAVEAPRLAGAIWALEETAAFEQLVLDVAPAHGAATALAELDVRATVLRVAGAPARLVGALEDVLAERDCAALMLHSDGPTALAGAIAAARLGVAVVGAGGGAEPRARTIARLADLMLVRDDEAAGRLVPAIEHERVHVVGSPVADVMRRYSRETLRRAAWRRHGVDPVGYVLAVLDADAPAPVAASLAAIAAGTPLIVVAPEHAAASLRQAVDGGARLVLSPGFLERMSLERGAGAIVSDCASAHEEAAILGLRCFTTEQAYGGIGGPEPAAARSTRPLWDTRAGSRIAEILVANFALLRLN